MMKILFWLLAVYSSIMFSNASAIECYTCTGGGTTNDCADNPTLNVTCPSEIQSCFTYFEVEDGLPRSVTRGCNFEEILSSQKCTLVVGRQNNNVVTTSCRYNCKGTLCNDIVSHDLKTCDSCDVTGGYCDYFSSTCVCLDGWEGDNCSTVKPPPKPVYRQCVQCDDTFDPDDCESKTITSPCPEPIDILPYCSSAKTITLSNEDSSIVGKPVVSRGCTAQFTHEDECFFSSPRDSFMSAKYSEYTCTSMCDTDYCNSESTNGEIDGNEKVPLYCLQCVGSDCQNGLQPTRCPSGSTHCVATVKYYLSEKTDHNYKVLPEYELKSIVRSCAKSSVIKGCQNAEINSNVPSSVQYITCQESCQKDGCNSGWPARPKCSTCRSPSNSNDDTCLNNPPLGRPCTHPYQGYCIASFIQSGVGNRGFVTRGCSNNHIGNVCKKVGNVDFSYNVCNTSCTTDNCNMGPIGSATAVVNSRLFILVSFALLCLFLDDIYC